MLKTVSAAVVAVTFALTVAPANASTTLTFSAACPGVCSAQSDYLVQSYGDLAGILDISYRSVAAPGSNVTVGGAGHWGTNFGDLNDVIFGEAGATLELAFALSDPTKMITLNSVDFASWDGTSRTTQMALYGPDGSGETLASTGLIAVPTTGHATWSPNVGALGGLLFHFGPDAYNVAIDNVTFTISEVAVAGSVPEPATWLSMIAGFTLVGAGIRRRTIRGALATA